MTLRKMDVRSWQQIIIASLIIIIGVVINELNFKSNFLDKVFQGLFLFTSISLLRKLLYDLGLGLTGRRAITIGCLIQIYPFIGVIFLFLLNWTALLIITVIFYSVVLIFGYYGKMLQLRTANQIVDLSHPYSPDADWIIAVSRKFNDPQVDELYFNQILPILREHGLVVECYFAGETADNIDYWVSRMNLIFEISDFHVILEHKPSFSTLYEKYFSEKFRRIASNQYLITLFGEDSLGGKIETRPFGIHLSDKNKRNFVNVAKSTANVYLPLSENDSIVYLSNLDECLKKIKKIRLISYLPNVVKVSKHFSNYSSSRDQRLEKEVFSFRFQVALLLSTQEGSKAFVEKYIKKLNKNQILEISGQNEMNEMFLKIKANERAIPKTFSETYNYFISFFKGQMTKEEWKLMRFYLSPLSFVYSVYIRIVFRDLIIK